MSTQQQAELLKYTWLEAGRVRGSCMGDMEVIVYNRAVT
jgi:hypothetical protein